jgi:hypothetical protein
MMAIKITTGAREFDRIADQSTLIARCREL